MVDINPSTTNLESWWALEDVNDSHGSNNLTNNGVATFAAGKVNNAVNLVAASTQYLSHADNASLSTGDINWTLAGWAKLTSQVANGMIATKYTDATHREYQMYTDGSFVLSFDIFDAGGTARGSVTETTTGALGTGTWYFIVAYHSETDNQVGVSVNAGTIDTAGTTGSPADTTAVFNLGARNNSLHWDGMIDEFVFYKKQLVQAEIDWLYNGGTGRSYAELTAFIPRTGGIF